MSKFDGPPLVIGVNFGDTEEEPQTIISKIKSLKPPEKRIEEEENDHVFLLSKNKKEKSKKKKKQKKSEYDDIQFMTRPLEDDTDGSKQTGDEPIKTDGIRYGRFLDAEMLDDDVYDDDGELITDEILRGTKKNYKKAKKENDFEKRFAGEIAILYELLDEVSQFGKNLEKKYKSIEASKVRGVSKFTNDLILSILTSKKSKLDVIREIASIKRIIADLKLKDDRKNKEKDGETTREQLASTYMSKIIQHGMGNFRKALNGGEPGGHDDHHMYDEDDGDIIRENGGYHRGYYSEDEDIDAAIEERLSREENQFRSSDADKYIKYENDGVSIFIKKCVDNGKWEFIALDKHGQTIYDYPMPNPKNVGRIKWSSDGTRATDARGISYKVIEYYSSIDED